MVNADELGDNIQSELNKIKAQVMRSQDSLMIPSYSQSDAYSCN